MDIVKSSFDIRPSPEQCQVLAAGSAHARSGDESACTSEALKLVLQRVELPFASTNKNCSRRSSRGLQLQKGRQHNQGTRSQGPTRSCQLVSCVAKAASAARRSLALR